MFGHHVVKHGLKRKVKFEFIANYKEKFWVWVTPLVGRHVVNEPKVGSHIVNEPEIS
jgi:hypothetical protein